MQRLQFALFQMDAATLFLADALSPALRGALRLLGDACAILIDQWIDQEFPWRAVAARIHRIPKPADSFYLYAGANTALERLEFMVNRLSAAIHSDLHPSTGVRASIH